MPRQGFKGSFQYNVVHSDFEPRLTSTSKFEAPITMELITSTSLKYLRRSFIFNRFFQYHPFTWERTTDNVEVVQSRWRILIWYINVTVTFAYYGFIVGRSIQINSAPTSTAQEKIYMQFAVVYYAFPVLFQISNVANREKFSPLVRRLLQFLRQCQGMRNPYCIGR